MRIQTSFELQIECEKRDTNDTNVTQTTNDEEN